MFILVKPSEPYLFSLTKKNTVTVVPVIVIVTVLRAIILLLSKEMMLQRSFLWKSSLCRSFRPYFLFSETRNNIVTVVVGMVGLVMVVLGVLVFL